MEYLHFYVPGNTGWVERFGGFPSPSDTGVSGLAPHRYPGLDAEHVSVARLFSLGPGDHTCHGRSWDRGCRHFQWMLT